MPGPVPKNITGFSGGAHNLIKAEPICMAHIAAVAIAWTENEAALIELVNGAMGTAYMQNEHAVGMSGNRVAKVAIEQAETIRTRIKLVNALIEPLLKGTELHANWKELSAQLLKCSRQRNEIVHARWGYTGELPGELVRLRPGRYERWRISDFEAVLKRFHALNMDIWKLQHDVGAAKAAGILSNTIE